MAWVHSNQKPMEQMILFDVDACIEDFEDKLTEAWLWNMMIIDKISFASPAFFLQLNSASTNSYTGIRVYTIATSQYKELLLFWVIMFTTLIQTLNSIIMDM